MVLTPMKTQDTIASWLLVLFVLGSFVRAFYELTDALQLNRPISTILWYMGVTLVVGASGLFLVFRFFHIMHELGHYEVERETKRKRTIERIEGYKKRQHSFLEDRLLLTF